MKTSCSLAILSIALTLTFSSCKKDKDKARTKTDLLTSKTWIYDEYFRGYNTNNTILYYKRGKANNLLNLDPAKVTFRTDGTYTEVNETGTTFNGMWKFLNGETGVQVINTVGTFSSTIIILDDQRYYWYDATTSNGTYGKMIPQ